MSFDLNDAARNLDFANHKYKWNVIFYKNTQCKFFGKHFMSNLRFAI